MDDYGTIHYVGRHYERNVGNGQDTSERITKYYYATLGSLSRLIALRRDGVLYYVHSDHLGGTVRVTDANGNIVDSITYTAYGQTRSGGTNLPTDRRFTGQILDLSTGLYWYTTRPYNPMLGRFTQPDTVVPDYQNPQSLNRYAYVLNNPLKYKDPSGHKWEPWFDGGGGSDEPPSEPGDNPPDNPPEPSETAPQPPAVQPSVPSPAPDLYGSPPPMQGPVGTAPTPGSPSPAPTPTVTGVAYIPPASTVIYQYPQLPIQTKREVDIGRVLAGAGLILVVDLFIGIPLNVAVVANPALLPVAETFDYVIVLPATAFGIWLIMTGLGQW